MTKIHTRSKRKLRLPKYNKLNTIKQKRPKTFNSIESAKVWASNKGIKPEQYTLKSVKHNKKFEIVLSENSK
jgi:hypothetical protein